ncbi:MAG: hypothetical protein LBR74_10340 [Eubacterium sp.]|nr:hypothetical protein [Eubacterium sp.]
MDKKADLYFLGGSAARGFVTRFNDIIKTKGYFTYILKGGPGTGKSTLIKKAAKSFSDAGTELYYCASDISSLDAVLLKEPKVIIVDGTAPHIFDAEEPGVSQCLVNLGEFWDREKLIPHEEKIRSLFEENKRFHRHAKRLIAAMTSLNGSIYEFAEEFIDLPTLTHFSKEYIKKWALNKNKTGRVVYKQLSAITQNGYITQQVDDSYLRIGIKDGFYAAGGLMMKEIAETLISLGYEITLSECNMFFENIIEHIFVPELKLCFSAVNNLNKLGFEDVVDCESFYDHSQCEEGMISAREMASVIEKDIASAIKKALEVHNELESYYVKALDFDSLDRKTFEIISEIHKRIK